MTKVLEVEASALASVRQAIEEAYKAGYRDAVAVMVKAAHAQQEANDGPPSDGGDLITPTPIAPSYVGMTTPSMRARRGLVRKVLGKFLDARPGLTIADYEKLVTDVEPEISAKSVGNELRRGEGTLYKRDVPRGNRWFLKGPRPTTFIGQTDQGKIAEMFD